MKNNQKMQNGKPQNDVKANAKTAFGELAAFAGLTKTPAPEPTVSHEPFKNVSENLSQPADTVPVAVPSEPKRHTEPSQISADVIVEGTIHTEGALNCCGVVKGDLIATEMVTMSGKQTGNIQGLQIHFTNACIEGNVSAKKEIEIDSATNIKGDVRGGSVVLDGHVTGLICAEGLVCLNKNAVLIGDIQAGSVSIEEGAQISGQISMKKLESKQKAAAL
ncbi:MAG: polymer-forming cytoskeletal protein, partial [Pygmaiobacter sp.]